MKKDIASLCTYVHFQHFFLTEPHFPFLLIHLLLRLILAAIINKPQYHRGLARRKSAPHSCHNPGSTLLVAGSFLPHDDSGTPFPSILQFGRSSAPWSALHPVADGKKIGEGTCTSNCLGSEVMSITFASVPLVSANHFIPPKDKGDWKIQTWLGRHFPVSTQFYKKRNFL